MKENAVKTPVEILRNISISLREKSTWEDVYKKVMDKRISDARRTAEDLEENNKYETGIRRIAAWAFWITFIGFSAVLLFNIFIGTQSIGSQIGTFLLSLLLYLIYGVMVRVLVILTASWFVILRQMGFHRLRNFLSAFKAEDISAVMKLMGGIVAFLIFAYIIDGYPKLILILILITLWLTFIIILTKFIPIRVVYLGVLSQDSLTLVRRLVQRLEPFHVLSYLSTGIEGSLAVHRIYGSQSFSTMNDLIDKLKEISKLPSTIVIDIRYVADLQNNEILNVIRDSNLSQNPLILINDNKESAKKENPDYLKGLDINGVFVTQKELFDILKPEPW